jgi:hypothetical protein
MLNSKVNTICQHAPRLQHGKMMLFLPGSSSRHTGRNKLKTINIFDFVKIYSSLLMLVELVD